MSSTNPIGRDALSTTVATHSCTGCRKTDSNQTIVTCNKCCALWHCICAGLPDGFDGPWRCNNCSTFCGSVAGSVSSVRSTSSARLRLKQLQELKALEDKIELEKAERERRFLMEKHSLEAEAEAEQTGGGSIKSGVSRSHNRQRDVNAWVESTKDVKQGLQHSDGFERPPAGVHTSTPVSGTGAVPKVHPPDTRVDSQQQQQVDQCQQEKLNVFNTPLGLPKHMLPPKKPSGILEPTLSAIPSSAHAGFEAPANLNIGHHVPQSSTHAASGLAYPPGIAAHVPLTVPTAFDKSSHPTVHG